MYFRLSVSALALLLLACASDPNTRGSTRRDRNLISLEEIQDYPITTAHDLVGRLRPTWLRNRGPTSISGGSPTLPLVYVDEVHSGGLDALYRISTQIIREIRFINGRDATTKWGLDHGGGVIMVFTGR
jgi:hypothetical protein